MPDTIDILYQCVLTSSYQSQLCQNVLWFRSYENSVLQDELAQLQDLHSNVNAWFVQTYKAFANLGWQPLTLTTKSMNGTVPYGEIRNYTNEFGARTGDGMPPHDAAVISLYTPFHGRRLHGRIYLTGLSESDGSGGLLDSSAVGRATQVGTDLFTRFGPTGSSGSARLVVFSRANGVQRSPGPPPHLVYDVLSGVPVSRFTVSNRIRTQRHRRIA